MKAIFLPWILLAFAALSNAATTINPDNRSSYGANLGWMDWRAEVAGGAVIGEFVCSGYLYSANAGWIHLGNGTPADSIRYQNNSASDYGVNHDGLGNLRGYAYGANIGWLTFTNRDATGGVYEGPTVDLVSGRLSGFVWSANCGWISLSNQFAFVQTDTIQTGIDTDGDGIPDAWELEHAPSLGLLTGAGDSDADGFSDVQEYLADTDPTDPGSALRITSYAPGPGGSPATLAWSSVATRQYQIQRRVDLNPGFSWNDVGLGLILPDVGTSTTRTFMDGTSPQRFYRIEAIRPLRP